MSLGHRPRPALLLWFAALLAVGSGADARAQDDFQPNLLPTIQIPRIADPIVIDGELDDAGWQRAARATNFSEASPGDNVRPPVETEAWVAYDANNLYIAFLCGDDPKAVRSSMTDRDGIFRDDYIGIILDTYGDHAWMYELFVNPLGIQGDLRWTGGNEDHRFDIIWHSRGKVTDKGWQVEVALPFSSLRFPDRPQQEWRATFWRNHPRDSRRRYSWASIDRDNPCWPCNFGKLVGIENVESGTSLELLPSATASQVGFRQEVSPGVSRFQNESVDGDASLNVRYAINSNTIAEGAVNPDFSQVEADAAQVDVNTTFALFFPERRPFFQEGADLFDSFIDAIYTRSINDPSVAARFTGRQNRTAYAYVVARDENTPVILPFEERSSFVSAGKSVSNIFRVKQTVLQDSYVGAIATDRRLDGGGSGTTMGLDGRLRFLKNFSLEFQGMASHTDEPVDTALTASLSGQTFDGGRRTSAYDGEKYWGNALYASLERGGRLWEFDLDFWQYSPTFRAGNGFVTRNNYRQGSGWTGLFFRPKDSFFDLILPNVSFGRQWNYDGRRKDEWIRPEVWAEFKAQTSGFVAFIWSEERFRDVEFPGIKRFQARLESRFSDPVSIGAFVAAGKFIARRNNPPVLGDGMNLDVWGTIKPTQRLVLEPTLNFSRLDHPDGSEIFEGFILRTRTQYQFTRQLFLRVVFQYNDFGDSFEVDPLLTYKVNPFTVGFIGSTHDYRDLGGGEGFEQTNRQVFAKVQYLFQM